MYTQNMVTEFFLYSHLFHCGSAVLWPHLNLNNSLSTISKYQHIRSQDFNLWLNGGTQTFKFGMMKKQIATLKTCIVNWYSEII